MAAVVVGPGSKPAELKVLPYWRLRGWTDNGRGLEGKYQTPSGVFWGFIEFLSKTTYRFFIFQPPLQQLRRHPKWPCFGNIGNGWYRINFSVPPKGVDDGIAKVEAILTEALRGE